MGIICELYIIENSVFNDFKEKPSAFETYLYENYGNPDNHDDLEGKTFFYLDKAWDIALFLLKENDLSDEKVLSKLKGSIIHKDMDGYSFVTSDDVKRINQILMTISDSDIENAYNVEKMVKEKIYNAGWLTKENTWEYILNHAKTIQLAFLKASENDKMIVFCKS